jgi:hypothetical protein
MQDFVSTMIYMRSFDCTWILFCFQKFKSLLWKWNYIQHQHPLLLFGPPQLLPSSTPLIRTIIPVAAILLSHVSNLFRGNAVRSDRILCDPFILSKFGNIYIPLWKHYFRLCFRIDFQARRWLMYNYYPIVIKEFSYDNSFKNTDPPRILYISESGLLYRATSTYHSLI